MHRAAFELEALIKRATAEFVEMPGLRLTIEQSSRLWGLERAASETVLRVLVDRKFLRRNADGKYGRATDGIAHGVSLRPAKSSLKSEPLTVHYAGRPAGRRAGERSSPD